MEGDECDRYFVEICGRVQSLMDQTVMRVLKFMSRIRDCHKEAPEMLLEPDNFERLSSIGYMVATVNYRISKWLHQLQPREYLKPMKPTESHFRERTVEELLRDVNFALSRSSVLASDLAPKLRKILGESSRGPKAKPEFLLDEPNSLSAGCNLEQVARRHGITDVQEIQGLVGHLERLLEVSHALAFRPAPSKVRISATILLASQRFKKLVDSQTKTKGPLGPFGSVHEENLHTLCAGAARKPF